jgi:hypothetical protein
MPIVTARISDDAFVVRGGQNRPVINHVMNNPNFLVCNSPKRLSIVEQEIWDI